MNKYKYAFLELNKWNVITHRKNKFLSVLKFLPLLGTDHRKSDGKCGTFSSCKNSFSPPPPLLDFLFFLSSPLYEFLRGWENIPIMWMPVTGFKQIFIMLHIVVLLNFQLPNFPWQFIAFKSMEASGSNHLLTTL